ncbi:Zn-dependent hydrolase [Bacillus sp. MUM 116]|uniref:Zn-dependent hydrolase n=1 Tax=Bacillus sp. MUM 116 TaxID=1678002 RepID=UPI0008F5A116|nr:Zn-dependent hydrolase [Bacillus sp. MUM 116]OIK14983.1 Zn-dependent hydrolase [Bacillus sp. MUM 116]
MQINIERLLADIEKYSKYGESPNGGTTRPSFSEADILVRELFIHELADMGLSLIIDGAANIWGRLKGSGKKEGCLVIGSHLDAVPNGGKYDGALGVLTAKEMIKTLTENNIVLDHDVEIVSFTAEESNDFNLSTFGSRSYVGKLTKALLENACDSKGNLIKDELEKVGGSLGKFPDMEKTFKDKKAFIELHIEQGQRLESENISLAIIDKVVGMYRSTLKVIGQSNHSGTTMMEHRKDALAAAAEIILLIEHICKNEGNDLVGTVGKLIVSPNATNIIPGMVEFTFEIRGESENQIYEVVNKIQDNWRQIALEREVKVEEKVFLNQKPIILDHHIVSALQNTAAKLDEPYLKLASMAVHDAAHMASVTKSAMVFVKSKDGKSHCPEEFSSPMDIEKAGNLMLHALIHLDEKLD